VQRAEEFCVVQRKQKMTCEEFEAIGLDAERDASLSEAERAAAREHASACSRCAALQDSWQAAGVELRAFAEDTAMAQAPARVEMRLRQEFRTRHVSLKTRRTAVIAAWALAAAAVLAGAVSWKNWRESGSKEATNHPKSSPGAANSAPVNASGTANRAAPVQSAGAVQPPDSAESETLMADNELNDFTLLPGALPVDTADAAILRVRMQRGSLGALGLPVNEERAGEWIQVDLLVGDDGLPQAVRLPQE
jgi:anti-sigma factor RsiW